MSIVSREPLVTGQVRMPNGTLASATSWRQWAGSLRLLATAYGTTVRNPNVSPVAGVSVTLSRVHQLDAADGIIGNDPGLTPLLLGQPAETDDNGRYTIARSPEAGTVDGCGLMVAAGAGAALTRAFVLQEAPESTDIDVVSETVVRVVLHRLTKAPPVYLCDDFTAAGLQAITEAVSTQVFTANGRNAAEINQAAFETAMRDPFVRRAIDDATGVPAAF